MHTLIKCAHKHAYTHQMCTQARMVTHTAGPVGCGKSTTVRLLAAELGYQVVEYIPPAFTLWSELQHQVGV